MEIARRIMSGYNTRDVEDMLEPVDPDVEWISAFTRLEGGGAYRGHEGFRQYLRDIDEQWSEFQLFPEVFTDTGEAVVIPMRVNARGRASGVVIDTRITAVFEFSDGKVIRAQTFLDHGQALEAAGLSE